METTINNNDDVIRVLLADTQAVVRAGLRLFLEQSQEFKIVGEAEDGETVLTLIQTANPHIIILDVSIPKISGFEITRLIQSHHWDVNSLIFTSLQDDAYISGFLKSGANGYLLKQASQQEIMLAVRDICSGKSVIDKNILQKVLSQASSPIPVFDSLTDREIEILSLVARGLTNKIIAYKLNISDRTVQGHIARIFEKLRASSRTDAVMRAIANGIIQSPETSREDYYSYEI